MSEWINPAPATWERDERVVDGVKETFLTPAAEIQHRQHLDLSKQERVQAYYADLAKAAEALIASEDNYSSIAAD